MELIILHALFLETGELGLLNGKTNQDVWKAELSDEVDNILKMTSSKRNEGDGIWKTKMIDQS